ncbi:hypothetical protein, partial [Pseudohalioglobus lutimaris]
MKPLDKDTSLEIRYERAIKELLDLALDHSDDCARIAADVLMSASNANRTPTRKWTVNLSELARINEKQAHSVLGVIHGKTSLKRNPKLMIPNGAELFDKVWRWFYPDMTDTQKRVDNHHLT